MPKQQASGNSRVQKLLKRLGKASKASVESSRVQQSGFSIWSRGTSLHAQAHAQQLKARNQMKALNQAEARVCSDLHVKRLIDSMLGISISCYRLNVYGVAGGPGGHAAEAGWRLTACTSCTCRE